MRALAGSIAVCAAAAAFAGCGISLPPSVTQDLGESTRTMRARSPIQHIVLIIQENRTFNDFFATFPRADGTTIGEMAVNPACGIEQKRTIKLRESGLVTRLDGEPQDLDHTYTSYATARNGGVMNGFDKIAFGNGVPECTYPYQYTDPRQIAPYWDMAKRYVLAEHMFTTQGSGSFTAHQDLIAGGTVVSPNEALVDLPSCSGPHCIWGCDAPKGTHTALITRDDLFQPAKGPFPCLKYATLRDLLDARGVSWRYYVPPMCCEIFGKLLSAFDAIKAVRYSPEWTDGHISSPQTNIFEDISNHQLQAVSWMIPDERASDHPGTDSDTGPSWVASVVNAIGESPYWASTVIVIVWDDWGGLYDNLDPPQLGYGGLGFRVPAIIVSPYALPRHISRTQYEFGSILKYIEQNWRLGSLGTSDKRATSILDCFNYSQKPIPFKPVPAKYSKSYFLHAKPSYLPVDTDF
jgi:phospholipase C